MLHGHPVGKHLFTCTSKSSLETDLRATGLEADTDDVIGLSLSVSKSSRDMLLRVTGLKQVNVRELVSVSVTTFWQL